MAHGDYNCCAVCDCKLAYAGGIATTKEEICSDCLRVLHGAGVPVYSGEELLRWLKKMPDKVSRVVLESIGFKKCPYQNALDDFYKELFGKIAPGKWDFLKKQEKEKS